MYTCGERVGWRGGFEEEGGLSGVCGAALIGVGGAGVGGLELRGIGDARYLTGESAGNRELDALASSRARGCAMRCAGSTVAAQGE